MSRAALRAAQSFRGRAQLQELAHEALAALRVDGTVALMGAFCRKHAAELRARAPGYGLRVQPINRPDVVQAIAEDEDDGTPLCGGCSSKRFLVCVDEPKEAQRRRAGQLFHGGVA